MSELRDCFDVYECDKGFRHSYDKLYGPEFESIRHTDIAILEVGVLRGESIRAWLNYFSDANIWCIDTFERVRATDIKILSHPRVVTITCDSQSEEIHSILPYPPPLFDIIIDDGEHSATAVQNTFKVLSQYLSSNGTYYIEDFVPTTEYPDNVSEKRLPNWHPRDVANALKTFEDHGFDVTLLDAREYSGKDNSTIVKLTRTKTYKLTSK